jgi:hypothetical protein
VPVLIPLEIEENNSSFLGICTGQNTFYLDLKNFSKSFWLHFVPGTTSKKIILKTKVVPKTGSSGIEKFYINTINE